MYSVWCDMETLHIWKERLNFNLGENRDRYVVLTGLIYKFSQQVRWHWPAAGKDQSDSILAIDTRLN